MTEERERDSATRSDAARTPGGALIGNAAWLSIALVLPQAYTLILSVAAARFLGPDDMGRQSYISFVVIVASTLAGLGLPIALQRFIAKAVGSQQPGQVRALSRLAWQVAAACGLLAFGAVLAVGATTYPDLRRAWLFAGMSAAFTAMHALPANILFGLERYVRGTLVGLVMGGVGVIGSLTALALGYGITGMFAVQAASTGTIFLGTALFAVLELRHFRDSQGQLSGLAREIAVFALAIGVSLIVDVVVRQRSEFFFLEAFSSSAQIAFYSVAFAAVTAAQRLPTAIIQLVIPTVSNMAGAQQHRRIATGYGRSMRLMLILSMFLTAAVMSVGPIALRVAYGADYAEAGALVAVLAPVVLLVGPLGAVAASMLNALGTLRAPLVWGIAAVVVTISFDVALIPRFGGAGAAVANNGGLIAGAIPLVYLAGKHLHTRWLRWTLVRPMVSAGLAGVAALSVGFALEGVATPGEVLILASIVGGAVALITVLAVGAIDADDADWLQRALGHRSAKFGKFVERLSVPRARSS